MILLSSQANRGVRMPTAGEPLVMEYAAQGWLEIADKIVPLDNSQGDGFNWLTEDGDVAVLVSTDGSW